MLGSEVDPSTRIDPLKFLQPYWTSGIQLPFSRHGGTIQVIILQPNWGQLRPSDESHVFKCAAPIIAVLGMQLSTVPQHGEPPPLTYPAHKTLRDLKNPYCQNSFTVSRNIALSIYRPLGGIFEISNTTGNTGDTHLHPKVPLSDI